MEAIDRAFADVEAIILEGGHTDWQRQHIAKIFVTLEKRLAEELRREPGPLCRSCGGSATST